MKKLYLTLILLFGFLAFVPQAVKADLLPRRSPYYNVSIPVAETEADRVVNQARLLQCLYEKKLKVPQKYTGTALKKQVIAGKLRPSIFSGFKYFGYGHGYGYPGEHPTKINGYAAYDGANCFEFFEHTSASSPDTQYYDVTDIPPGSYLKYVRATDEYEVFSPKENSYKQFIWNKMKNLEKKVQDVKDSAFSGDEKEKADKLKELQIEIRKEFKLVEIPLSTPQDEFMRFFLRPDEDITEAAVNFGETGEKQPQEKTENAINTNTDEELKYSIPKSEAEKKVREENYETMYDFAMLGMFYALILTIIIEGIVALPFGWKFVGLVTLANIITNPAINAFVWHYHITSTPIILLLEVAVVLVEWGIFSVFVRKNYGKLLLFSLIANAVSYLSGFLFPIQ